jgi:uncharacterized lipoprotein YajG
MKRLALVAAVIAVAACSKADNAATDTTPPAMAPAPMSDSMRMADSVRLADSVRKADSTKKADSIAAATKKKP